MGFQRRRCKRNCHTSYQTLKRIWYDAKETAIHHTKHLKEFATAESLPYYTIDIKEVNPMLCAAFINVDETNMKIFRDALKPHRGEVVA